jgi:hypothetical protein
MYCPIQPAGYLLTVRLAVAWRVRPPLAGVPVPNVPVSVTVALTCAPVLTVFTVTAAVSAAPFKVTEPGTTVHV